MKIEIETNDYSKIVNTTKWEVGVSRHNLSETLLDTNKKTFHSLEDAQFYKQHMRVVEGEHLSIVEVRSFLGKRIVV